MRSVPPQPILKLVPRKCSTKLGRSVGLFRGNHSIAWPRSPAMEVKVPHSCATRPGSSCFCAWPAREAHKTRAVKKTHARRSEGPADVCRSEKMRLEVSGFIAVPLLPEWFEGSFPPWSDFLIPENDWSNCVRAAGRFLRRWSPFARIPGVRLQARVV